MNEENNGYETNQPSNKKSFLIPIISIVVVLVVVGIVGFVFKDKILYAISPKTYLSTSVLKTTNKLNEEFSKSLKANKFFNDVDATKLEKTKTTLIFSDYVLETLGIQSKDINVVFKNDPESEKFAFEINQATNPLYSFNFSNDSAVFSAPKKSLYFDPKTFADDYNVWIVKNKEAITSYGITGLPDSFTNNLKYDYNNGKNIYSDKDLEVFSSFKDLYKSAKMEKQNIKFDLSTGSVDAKEMTLTFAPTDLQVFYDKTLSNMLANEIYLSQLQAQAAARGISFSEYEKTLKELKITGDAKLNFVIYKDVIVSLTSTFVSDTGKIAVILKTSSIDKMINDFSLDVAAGSSKVGVDFKGDVFNKDVLSGTFTFKANSFTVGVLKMNWDFNKTDNNLEFIITDVPPILGAPLDFKFLLSAFVDNKVINFNLNSMDVNGESQSIGYTSKIEEFKDEIIIPKSDLKLFDLSLDEIMTTLYN